MLRITAVVVPLALLLVISSIPVAFADERPSARGYHGLAYDSGSAVVVLFGGSSRSGLVDLTDTWLYNAGSETWTELMPIPSPPAAAAPLAYDVASDRTILTRLLPGSAQIETWAFDLGNNSWRNMSPIGGPSGRNGARIAYDEQSDRIILFGGQVGVGSGLILNDTWAYDYDTNTWTKMNPPLSPPGRLWHRMVYDAQADRIILFGGFTSSLIRVRDTWAYDYDADMWTALHHGNAPTPRAYHGMVYDAGVDRVILFGGAGTGDSPHNDTWIYDSQNDTWSQVTPAVAPTPRAWHDMVFAGSEGGVILFGGGPDRFSYVEETWRFDSAASTWTLLEGPSPPVATFDFTPPSPVAGEVVTFDASASADPDGTIVATDWDFGDGEMGGGAVVEHVYVNEGVYNVSLTVTDNDDQVSTNVQQLTVSSAPDTELPVVVISSPNEGAILTALVAEVSGTASDNVAIVKVELSTDGLTWQRAAGTTAWSASVTLNEGSNTITARASDASGNTVTDSVTVAVNLPTGDGPGGNDPTGDGPEVPWLVIAGIGSVGVVGVIVALLLLRRRRGG